MNLLLIGHSVEDHIGDRPATPGGIYFSAAAVSILAVPGDTFSLHTFIEEANYHLFAPVYQSFCSDFFVKVRKIPRVHLTLHQHQERTERFENINAELPCIFPNTLNPDGILLNMITGYETTPEKLSAMKHRFQCPIYMDTHSLSRGYSENQNRDFRTIPDSEQWLKSVDILQANELEIMTYPFGMDEASIANTILSMGTKIVLVTKGEMGVTCYIKDGAFHIAAPEVDAINKVGCGDVFGATFFSHYIRNGALTDALQVAVKTASFVTTLSNHNFYSGFKNAFKS